MPSVSELISEWHVKSNLYSPLHCCTPLEHYAALNYTVSVLGRDEGYTVKYNPFPEGVTEGKARGNS